MNRLAEKGQLGNVRLILRVVFEASEQNSEQWQLYVGLRNMLSTKLNVDLMLVLASDLPADLEFRRWVG